MTSLLADYASSAVRAHQLGFDGIEIHGAHGYLLDEFLWARTNRRQDRFGMSTDYGATFPSHVVQAVRAAVGPDFPISYRISQWKVDHYDDVNFRTPDQLEAVLAALVDAGVDIFHVSTRRHWDPAFDEETTLAGWTRKLSGLPVIAVGSFGMETQFGEGDSPRRVELERHCRRLLMNFEKEEFDVVAIGRGLLGDPLLIRKILSGDYASVRGYEKGAASGSKPRTA
jgi:2,4-dienoyl-CoA reductase-like NADH-dependent reductase (Old Yellow Enzyme family)